MLDSLLVAHHLVEQLKSNLDIASVGSYNDGALKNIPIVPQTQADVKINKKRRSITMAT